NNRIPFVTTYRERTSGDATELVALTAMAGGPRFEQHMSDEDALMWLAQKDPILRSTIVAVALFDRPPDFARLRARIERATCLIPRFRQRGVAAPIRLRPPPWVGRGGVCA